MSAVTEALPSEGAVRPWRASWLQAGGLILLVALTYSAVWSAGFIWDDDLHVTANPCIVGPAGLKEIWTSASANYFPLVLTNFWGVHALWGLNPLPYHLLNVALHALGALLLWRVLRRLGVPGAWLGATLWALHPVQVESVAWISELKNTQSAVFFLAAVWFFLRWSERRARDPACSPVAVPRFKLDRDYLLLLGCAAAALLSKSSTVMLPVALWLCAWWREGRWSGRILVALAPLFALSATVSAWTIWEQKYHSFALGPDWDQSLPARCAIAGKDLWFYLGELVWPDPLIFIYPRWATTAGVGDFLPLLAALGGVALLVRSAKRSPGRRAAWFAAAYFVALLFPVLGFFNVYFFRYSFVADHFQYLASMGPLALLGAGLAVAAERVPPFARRWFVLVPSAIIALFAGLSAQAARTYADATTLWQTTLARNPACWLAETILGSDALAQGRLEDALRLERHAISLHPTSPEAQYNLGLALKRLERNDEAIAAYRRALALKPDFAAAEHNLGVALASGGRFPEAIAHYERALRLKPAQAESQFMLGVALTLSGQGAAAVSHYEAALRTRPAYPEAEYAFGITEAELGRPDQALAHFRAAVTLRPNYVEARRRLAAALSNAGDAAGAIEQFNAAVQLDPNDAELRSNFATALLAAGRIPDAIAQCEAALRANPRLAAAHYNLALALRAVGRSTESVSHYAEAQRLQPDLPPLPPR
jgi:protein O-mannosyl-transferase